ncbi:helix-turn-helix transcriptional regulator [Raoultibacter timonensis]|uniref:helix-turn-helix transcriptional regulator n=1 Tax=Raoultibacter timonensis TaxID=1907662 RepID=UPI0026DCA8AA|nr:helix-turn-helix transcriptional regulator [Raoultibacter timonensis]
MIRDGSNKKLLDRIWDKIPPTPFCFLGMGIFRVWTGTVNDSAAFPLVDFSAYGYFDIVTAVFLLCLAALSRWIVPLCRKPFIFPLTGFFMIACACMRFYTVLHPELAATLTTPALFLGALGVGLILMLWSEFYGCINPLRVALYYSAGIIVSVFLLWIFKGLAFYWLWAGTCIVPVVSLGCLWRSYKTLPEDEYPHASWGKFSFPWKPILVVCLYSFAFGLHESIFHGYLSYSSGEGDLFAALFVYLGIMLRRETFNFSLIWKLAMPLMLLSLVPFGLLLPGGSWLTDVSAVASYTLYTILIVVILSNLSYRYGVCALWIFGIERAVRLIAVQAGIGASQFIWAADAPQSAAFVPTTVIIAVIIVIVTRFFFSEKQLSSPWGVLLEQPLDKNREAYLEKNRIGMKCRELAKQYDLTTREEEILLLLCLGKKPAAIEEELYVAKSTVKTHIKHIYQKMGLHSREELFELVGVNPRCYGTSPNTQP